MGRRIRGGLVPAELERGVGALRPLVAGRPLWVRYLPIETQYSWRRPMLVPLASVSLGIIGLVIALVGRRFGDQGRAGLFLNATICGVALLLAGGLALWWTFRRW